VEYTSSESGHRFALLYQLSQTFSSSLDLTEVLDLVIDEVVKALKAERGFIALWNENGTLEFRSARGLNKTTIEQPEFEISRGVVREVAKCGKGICISDAQADVRFRDRPSVLDLNLHSILCTPLKLKDKILGVIYIDNRMIAGIFTKKELELLSAIATTAVIAIENARLYEVAIEKGRMERELQMAYRVQSSLIPQEMPQIPGWEFAACWQPARQVSGDFYDLIPVSKDELKFVIADVTDKGMPAALFMALTRTIVRASCDTLESLAEGITRANQLICTDSALAMPVTLFAGKINIKTGQLIYVNAGQNPPMYYRAEHREFINLTRTGMLLGFEEKAEFQQKSIQLKPGDLLVCYTDGVLDAVDEQWEAFEMDRFQAVLDKNVNATPKELLEAIEGAVCEFIGDVLPYDDITVFIIKRLGAEQ
jgi:sigma-B regulation protein RsbU (phosphoserine phosphatase)